jgi:DNA-directed RNA polymerase omega subunit
MFNFARESLIDKAKNSIYKLVTLTAKRALEIAEGSPKLVEAGPNEKAAITALREISENKVSVGMDKKEAKHEKK